MTAAIAFLLFALVIGPAVLAVACALNVRADDRLAEWDDAEAATEWNAESAHDDLNGAW
jgi:hypothetical protein